MFPYNVSHNTLSFSLTFLFIFLIIDVGRTLPCFVVDRNIANVDARHFANDRTSKSLGYKFIGPCRITRVIDNKAYQVELPVSLAQAGVTDVFHPDRLAPAPARSFPGQHTPEQPPVFVSDGDGTYHREWETSEIVDCRRNAAGGVEYRAKFIGDWPEWNICPPWQPWTDFVNSPQKVIDYHALHPRKPPPPSHFT